MELVILIIAIFGLSSAVDEGHSVEEEPVVEAVKLTPEEQNTKKDVGREYIDTERGYLFKNLTSNQTEE